MNIDLLTHFLSEFSHFPYLHNYVFLTLNVSCQSIMGFFELIIMIKYNGIIASTTEYHDSYACLEIDQHE